MLQKIILFSIIWWVFAGGAIDSFFIGLPAILLAAYVSVRLAPPKTHTVSIRHLAYFIYYFVVESFKGGFDIARRVLRTQVDVSPNYYDYELHLQNDSARLLFASSMSLLPGTLAVNVKDNILTIHSLLDYQEIDEQIRYSEQLVQNIFVESSSTPSEAAA